MRYLKQSTSVDVGIGPFLDETDGKTAETGLTITQPDIRLKKNGGAWAQKAAAQTLTHEENGWYEVTLDTTDTDTIGHLLVAVHESGALPVWCEFHVLAANVYDSLFGAATDKLDVNVEEWNTTAVPAEHTAGYPVVTVKDGTGTGEINTNAGAIALVDLVTTTTTATTATNVTTVNGLAAGVITAASIAADAITAAKVAADVSAEIADAVWDEDATGHQTGGTFGQAIGDPGADANTIFAAVVTNATGNTVGDDTATLLTRLGTPSNLGGGATVAANLSDIEGQTDDIGAAGAGLTAVPWNAAWDAEVQSEVQDALEANNLDHLVKLAVDTDFATTVHLNSVVGHLADNGTSATFDRTTDSLEAVYNKAVDVETDTADIQGRLPAALVSGRIDASVGAMAANTLTASALAADAVAEVQSGLSTLTAANVQAECEEALQTYHLDHLIASADPGSVVADSSFLAKLVSKSATPAFSSYSNQTDSLEALRDNTGTAGAGLSAVPWNASWDAEVQSEVEDGLVAHRLDELLNADSDIDGAAPPTVGSVFHELLTKTAGSFTYDQTTDSLEALRDRGDAAWVTATGFSTHSAADVWSSGTRTLTAGTNIQLPSNGLANVTAWTVAITGNVTGNLSGSVGSVTTVSDKTGYSLAAAGLDSVTVETGLNARQALSIIASASAGVLAGAATTTVTISAAGVSATNRISATVDGSGNRSAVTLSPPS